jgi:uncharacterized phage protein (TIGR01671 family)
MREILFRGKRISNNEWVIGGIMQTFHPNYDCENEKDFFSQNPNCYCICANNKDYFVEQSSIGQYTGLTDKNGKKIFEGDIVKISGDLAGVYVSVWEEYNFEYEFDNKEMSFGLCCVHSDDIEVIGNIHDNPELLAKK